MSTKFAFIISLILMLPVSCGQRLRPALFEIKGESRLKLNLENAYFRDGFMLVDTYEANPVKPGGGKILVTNQTITDLERSEISTGLIKTTAEIHYRIYVALPEKIIEDSLDIAGRSICRIIGMYELADSLRHYVCSDGYLKIDTVKSSRFHARLSGKYFNVNNDSLIFDGSLGARRKK